MKVQQGKEKKETKVGGAAIGAAIGVSLKPSSAIPFTRDHCSNCGLPVMSVYVVYKKSWDKELNREVTVEGRFEVRHAETVKVKKVLEGKDGQEGVEVEEEQVMLFNGDGSCPVPERGELYKYTHMTSNRENTETVEEETETVIQQQTTTRQPINLLTTTIKENTDTMSTEEGQLSKGEIIKRKIAEAKAKKQAGGTVGKGGKATVEGKVANLTGKKAKPAKEKKVKEPKAPKFLNLCGDGCGEKVKRNFAMGHDARFHGWIKRLADGRMKPNDIPAQVAKMLVLVKKGEGYVPKLTEEQYLEGLKGMGGAV